MDILSLMKNFSNFTYKHLTKSPGTMLLITGTVGWFLSALAQLTAVTINNKIPKEQKKFLIPQESFDAAINIASFYLITRKFTKVGENLVKSGKLITPAIKNFINSEAVSKLGSKGFDITSDKLVNFTKNPKLQNEYYKLADGVSFISSVVGAIISCNLVTPFLRNKAASYFQYREIGKDKIKKETENTNQTITTVIPPQNKPTIDNYRAKTMNSGSMKI